MKFVMENIVTSVEEGAEAAVPKAVEALNLPKGCLVSAALAKTSVDSRHARVRLVSSVALEVTEAAAARLKDRRGLIPLPPAPVLEVVRGERPLGARPVVVGFGPAGMFAALLLARSGYRPLVLERGAPMEERTKAVERFWSGGPLDPEANVQFGEGGAGAFSDGKLVTRINDPLCRTVLEELAGFGAPKDILIRSKPHVGTDRLAKVVTNLREEVVRLGGEVRFHSRVEGFRVRDGRLCALLVGGEEVPAQAAVVAAGHSARDTFEALALAGAQMQPKPFSVGVRIEHRQQDIDRALYGRYAGHPNLPKGEYQLSHRDGERAAYTFCMCPGGMVVAAASANGQVVTNGMSRYARDLPNANSALVVSVGANDFGGDWRDGVRFQQSLEQAAFTAGGGIAAPSMTVGELLGGGGALLVEPSYPRGVTAYDLTSILPAGVSDMMRKALPVFGKKLRGFDHPGAVMTGVETRTSSPVRVLRTENGCAAGIDGLFPSGEGAGYAGGIVSAAIDGLRCAGALAAQYRPGDFV